MPEYRRSLADLDEKLPPILVNRESLVIIDGIHRLRAAEVREMAKQAGVSPATVADVRARSSL